MTEIQRALADTWLLWRVIRVIGGCWMGWGVLLSLRAMLACWRWWVLHSRPDMVLGAEPPEAVAALGRRVGELETELATLAADLERVSATTRPLIAAQVASLTTELEQARAPLAAAGTDQTPDPAAVREWLTMVRQPELWQRPRAELRARLHRFIPALYVLGGELVPPPQVPE